MNALALQNLYSDHVTFDPDGCLTYRSSLPECRGTLALQNLSRVKDGKVHTIQGARIKHISDNMKKMAKKNALQNLAWLGENGNVHTVQQPNDGTMLLGATRPDALQNLDLADAYLAWYKKILNYANSPQARNAYIQWFDDNIDIANHLARGQNQEGFHDIANAGIHALGAFKDFVDTPAEYDVSPTLQNLWGACQCFRDQCPCATYI